MDKKLYRSKNNKVLGGVIAGVVAYFGWDIDPNIARLLYALLSLGYGAGILVYLIAWIIIPLEP